MPLRPPASSTPSDVWEALPPLLEEWFRASKRDLPWRDSYDPYHVWVSEVMLQQTRMSVVVPYFLRFVEQLPTVEALAAADEEIVLSLWSGLGYYRRARMLQAGARHVVSEQGGVIPYDPEVLRAIPGVGRYTAGALASIGFDRRAAIVDGNVARVFARFFDLPGEAGSALLTKAAWATAEKLVEICGSPRDFNQSLMELGATICTPRQPSCEQCPVRSLCANAGGAEAIPPPAKRKATAFLTIPLYVVTDVSGRVLLRRESGKLMGGMFHLPHGADGLIGKTAGRWKSVATVASFRHTVTHRNIEFVVEQATVAEELGDREGEWIMVDPAELASVPHPSYVAKALRLYGKKTQRGVSVA